MGNIFLCLCSVSLATFFATLLEKGKNILAKKGGSNSLEKMSQCAYIPRGNKFSKGSTSNTTLDLAQIPTKKNRPISCKFGTLKRAFKYTILLDLINET